MVTKTFCDKCHDMICVGPMTNDTEGGRFHITHGSVGREEFIELCHKCADYIRGEIFTVRS